MADDAQVWTQYGLAQIYVEKVYKSSSTPTPNTARLPAYVAPINRIYRYNVHSKATGT